MTAEQISHLSGPKRAQGLQGAVDLGLGNAGVVARQAGVEFRDQLVTRDRILFLEQFEEDLGKVLGPHALENLSCVGEEPVLGSVVTHRIRLRTSGCGGDRRRGALARPSSLPVYHAGGDPATRRAAS